ncbi:hypothetical protein B0H17DRAFT_1339771 [Mycena rosella]|uniref:Uncharacterized protein n=1 Tax=Mycena rosella TaxID=1033263 RepID=A0AAD7BVA9_MYCRO|nr:hypothetical protein B0H17DRAFT_1339771 [Mycena rosella]
MCRGRVLSKRRTNTYATSAFPSYWIYALHEHPDRADPFVPAVKASLTAGAAAAAGKGRRGTSVSVSSPGTLRTHSSSPPTPSSVLPAPFALHTVPPHVLLSRFPALIVPESSNTSSRSSQISSTASAKRAFPRPLHLWRRPSQYTRIHPMQMGPLGLAPAFVRIARSALPRVRVPRRPRLPPPQRLAGAVRVPDTLQRHLVAQLANIPHLTLLAALCSSHTSALRPASAHAPGLAPASRWEEDEGDVPRIASASSISSFPRLCRRQSAYVHSPYAAEIVFDEEINIAGDGAGSPPSIPTSGAPLLSICRSSESESQALFWPGRTRRFRVHNFPVFRGLRGGGRAGGNPSSIKRERMQIAEHAGSGTSDVGPGGAEVGGWRMEGGEEYGHSRRDSILRTIPSSTQLPTDFFRWCIWNSAPTNVSAMSGYYYLLDVTREHTKPSAGARASETAKQEHEGGRTGVPSAALSLNTITCETGGEMLSKVRNE